MAKPARRTCFGFRRIAALIFLDALWPAVALGAACGFVTVLALGLEGLRALVDALFDSTR